MDFIGFSFAWFAKMYINVFEMGFHDTRFDVDPVRRHTDCDLRLEVLNARVLAGGRMQKCC